ncbi:MAG: ATP synthase F1 subunit epsilon [Rhodospirillales bacterium]|jgi:F-type H+-transporting ATPase subunit epsilon|nr:ATP synthase F1 subunit epsilon [Rhodospirillales bacterium]
MADKVAFELVTPEKIMTSIEADMVVAPGGDGNFGVLPGHAPLLSTLRPGVVDIYEGEIVSSRIFVGGGFAEVNDEGFTVLAEEAVALEDIDAASASARLEKAQDALAEAEEEETAAAEAEIKIAEALVEAAGA